MSNDKPCGECKNYDVIQLQRRNGEFTATRRGWCAAKSIYPAIQPPGKIFPRGVRRAAQGAASVPYIVMGAGVEKNCKDFKSKK